MDEFIDTIINQWENTPVESELTSDDVERIVQEWTEYFTQPAKPLKKCATCMVDKCETEFYVLKRGTNRFPFTSCKPCTCAKQRARIQTPEGSAKRKATTAKYAAGHTELIREKNRRYQPTANARAVERRKTDLNFKMAGALRSRIVVALRGKYKSAKTVELIGCSVDEFIAWIAHQFSGEMSWDNYGSRWEIDHVRPCCSFNLADPAQQLECFNWKNQRPALCSDNRSKNGFIDHELIASHQQTINEWIKTLQTSTVTTLTIGQSAAKLPATEEEGSETRR